MYFYVPDIQGLNHRLLFYLFLNWHLASQMSALLFDVLQHTLVFFMSQCLSKQISVCTHITIDHRNFPTWQISWRATGGGRAEANACPCPFVLLMTHPHFLSKKWAKCFWYMFGKYNGQDEHTHTRNNKRTRRYPIMTMWWEMMTLRVHGWQLPQRHQGKCIYLHGTTQQQVL